MSYYTTDHTPKFREASGEAENPRCEECGRKYIPNAQNHEQGCSRYGYYDARLNPNHKYDPRIGC